MYYEFSTSNIQVDKDFSAKLSGYGCASYNPDADVSDSSIVSDLHDITSIRTTSNLLNLAKEKKTKKLFA